MKQDPSDCDCSANCLNRMIFIECNQRECKVGQLCNNNAIQRKIQPPIEIFKTKKKGFGIRATKHIAKNTYIIEYTGQVVSRKTFANRLRMKYKNSSHHYGMNFYKGLVIDAYQMGNKSRYINHSCDPNSEVQKWMVNGMYKMCIFSQKDIQSNEEITFDYKFKRSCAESQLCFCESAKCRRTIGQ